MTQINEITNAKEYNDEIASRLRGMASLVENCSAPAKIRISAKMRFIDGTEFKTNIMRFDQFSDQMMLFSTRELLKRLETAEDHPDRDKMRGMLTALEARLTEK